MTDKIRVLIADDEPHSRLLMGNILGKIDCEVIAEAENGQQAVELYHQHQPDLVLMDLKMPLMNGIEALKAILAKAPDAVVIILTSIDDLHIVQECLDAGAANYLRKDLLLLDLRHGIQDTWEVFSKALEKT